MSSTKPTPAANRVWHQLVDQPSELNLFFTLQNGQCFGWRRVDPVDQFVYVECGSLVFDLCVSLCVHACI
jgi:hypothetical protein